MTSNLISTFPVGSNHNGNLVVAHTPFCFPVTWPFVRFPVQVPAAFVIEKTKKSSTKAVDLAKNVASDISSIKTYSSITSRYEDLIIPQLYKT